jgi:hypothetical protein
LHPGPCPREAHEGARDRVAVFEEACGIALEAPEPPEISADAGEPELFAERAAPWRADQCAKRRLRHWVACP